MKYLNMAKGSSCYRCDRPAVAVVEGSTACQYHRLELLAEVNPFGSLRPDHYEGRWWLSCEACEEMIDPADPEHDAPEVFAEAHKGCRMADEFCPEDMAAWEAFDYEHGEMWP